MKCSSLFRIGLILFVLLAGPASSQPTSDTVNLGIGPIKLTDINFEFEKVEKDFKKIESTLVSDESLVKFDSTFTNYKVFLNQQTSEFKSYNPYNLSKFFLENSYRLWEGFYLKLMGWQKEVNNRLQSVQGNLQQLNNISRVWQLTVTSDEFADEPEEFRSRIIKIIERAEYLKTELTRQKKQYIRLENEISELASFCNDIITGILQLQQNQRDSLFIADTPPLWSVSISKADYAPVSVKMIKVWHENTKILGNYFKTQSLRTLIIWWIVILLLFLLLRNGYLKRNFSENQPGHKHITRIFINHPLTTLLSLFLVTFHLMFPYYPLVLNHILTLILLINMRYILSNFIDRQDKHFIFRLIILLLVNDLEVVFWYFGHLARYYVLMETILGIGLSWKYLKPAEWRDYTAKSYVKKTILLLSVFIFLFYLVAFFSNLLGYLDMAVLMAKVGIHVPEFTVVLYGIYIIVVALIRALVRIGLSEKDTLLSNYWESIEKRAIQVSGILAVLYWIYSFTVSFEVSRVVYDSIVDFLLKERTIGTLQITIGSILALVLILMVTFIITGFLKVVLEQLLKKQMNLPRGVPAAISVTIRYFLIILGTLFALSAAGIELGKFSLLAGALGVGIGFGLQNIVNNFISGLILVYERPIQVGDTIEVENLLGQVNRIGIRSSNVKTYDGAEVVVPNGNLISNQLINWTLSDNRRRIEIKVGTSYGSDPNVVLKLLEEVASGHEDVLKDPAPVALFENFGESSLNFRLLFWVPYDIGIRTKSAVAIGVYNIFRENGIVIPFPQVDLHVKKEDDKVPEEEIRAMESAKKNTKNKAGQAHEDEQEVK